MEPGGRGRPGRDLRLPPGPGRGHTSLRGGHRQPASPHAARAWFNLGTLHQERGEITLAVTAYRGALEYRHPEVGPRAAVNLGFVLFTELGQVEEAEPAFRVALEGSDPEQAALARQNLATMHQMAADRRLGRRHDGVQDATDLSVGRGKGTQRWTRWVRRDRS